ncbi:hypothetical protein SVIOM342S_07220 [Streptomyces violaceorubidus]
MRVVPSRLPPPSSSGPTTETAGSRPSLSCGSSVMPRFHRRGTGGVEDRFLAHSIPHGYRRRISYVRCVDPPRWRSPRNSTSAGGRPAAHEPASAEPGDQGWSGAGRHAVPPHLRRRHPHRGRAVLLDEARALLDRADRVRARVATAAGAGLTLTVGILGDSADPDVVRLADAHRESPERRGHRSRDRPDRPHLRAARRTGRRGAHPRPLRPDRPDHAPPCAPTWWAPWPRADDPLAGLARAWTRRSWPTAAGSVPAAMTPCGKPFGTAGSRAPGRWLRTVRECREAVLWQRHGRHDPRRSRPRRGARRGPATGLPPSPVVLAWPRDWPEPLVRAFVRTAIAAYDTP